MSIKVKSRVEDIMKKIELVNPFIEPLIKNIPYVSYLSVPLSVAPKIYKGFKFFDNGKGKKTVQTEDGIELQYEGDIVQGRPCGQGILKDSEGKIFYKGGFRDNDFYGRGEGFGLIALGEPLPMIYWAKGEMVNGNLDGEVSLAFSRELYNRASQYFESRGFVWLFDDNNTGFGKIPEEFRGYMIIYKGGFRNNLAHGYGHFRSPNGTEYKGEFYQGKFHGEGWYNLRELSTLGILGIHGIFEDHKLVKIKQDDGTYKDYEGFSQILHPFIQKYIQYIQDFVLNKKNICEISDQIAEVKELKIEEEKLERERIQLLIKYGV